MDRAAARNIWAGAATAARGGALNKLTICSAIIHNPDIHEIIFRLILGTVGRSGRQPSPTGPSGHRGHELSRYPADAGADRHASD